MPINFLGWVMNIYNLWANLIFFLWNLFGSSRRFFPPLTSFSNQQKYWKTPIIASYNSTMCLILWHALNTRKWCPVGSLANWKIKLRAMRRRAMGGTQCTDRILHIVLVCHGQEIFYDFWLSLFSSLNVCERASFLQSHEIAFTKSWVESSAPCAHDVIR